MAVADLEAACRAAGSNNQYLWAAAEQVERQVHIECHSTSAAELMEQQGAATVALAQAWQRAEQPQLI
jgi:hypothetical protein